MATYYVRKNGSDANTAGQAQNPATAWLTIDKAANNVAAGDTVYVGAGTYRESVTMDTSGSSGSQITFVADVDGSQTGDPGLVVLSAFTDSNTVTRTLCWDPDGRTFVTVRGFVMQGGTLGVAYDANTTAQNYEGVIFEDCVFVAGPDGGDDAMRLDANAGTTPTNDGLTVRRCVFHGSGLVYRWDGNATAERNLKVTVENCLFIGQANSLGYGFYWFQVSASTFGSGGVTFTNNTVVGMVNGVLVSHGASTTYPVAVRNSTFNTTNECLLKTTSNDGALTSNYNSFTAGTPLTNVTAGANDRSETSTWLLGGIADYPLYRFLGWSPFKPWEPMRPQDDTDWTSLIGDADTAVAPAVDLYNNPRPMHGTVDDRGAVEGRARAEKETTTVRTGANAIRFDGAGYHDILVPVAAQSTTITVYARKDGNYTGTAPQLIIQQIPGVADITDTHTAAANTWEQLTSGAFTPTSAGVCRVRLLSNDTSATGQSFFDDLELA